MKQLAKKGSLKSLLTIRHLFITTFPTCQLPKGTYVLVLYIVLVLMCLNIYLPRLRLHKWAIYDLLKRDFSCTPSEMDLKGVLDSEKINKKECGFLCGHLFSFWKKKWLLDFDKSSSKVNLLWIFTFKDRKKKEKRIIISNFSPRIERAGKNAV